tara:strand:- start:7054 stop:9618 length:2565 start_codon:yes stop_codon:yes gene_type:complete
LLIKNKNFKNKYILITKYFLNSFFKILGFISFISILIILFFYFSSGMSQRYGAKIFFNKINKVIFNRYLGFDFNKLDQYIDVLMIKTKTLIIKPKIENIVLEVNQKVILQLEKQRQIKIKKKLNEPKFLMHNILIKNGDKKLQGKIRIKGDRSIHWKDRNKTSYKIDMRKNDRIWGLEEFSIQKPITRNYTYEYLFHKFLEEAGLLSLKYFFVNLYFNDENRGLYAVEESFSKELLERQKKRNGPIFGLEEEISNVYPNVYYDLYSSQYWLNEHQNLVKSAFSILNNQKDNEKDFNTFDHFDLDKWARFFAVIDITGTFHGSMTKSVKLFFNPIQAKFEPIGFDGHYMDNIFSDFILADFLQEDKINCSFLCQERDWYNKFFKLQNGELNYKFIDKYVFYLKKYSNLNFLKDFLNKNKKEIDRINTLIYSEKSNPDRGLWKGISTFIYDDQLLYKRSKLIEERINSVKFQNYKLSLKKDNLIIKDTHSKFPIHMTVLNCKSLKQTNFYMAGNMKIILPNECNKISLKDYNDEDKIFLLNEDLSMNKDKIFFLDNKFDDLSDNENIEMISKNNFIISKNLELTKNTYIPKNINFLIKEGVIINILKDAILFVEGNVQFIGKDKNKITIQSDGSGSIIFLNNSVDIKNMIVENLGYPKLNKFILYGGVNFINTNLNLENILVKNSQSEDGINIVDSNATLKNISFDNIESDAVDIDFGFVKFNNIMCNNVKNDCLDISGSKIIGTVLNVNKSDDKGLSVGENSKVEITNLTVENSKIGFAIKDGSDVYLENVKSINNQYDLALFNKKQEFDTPFLEIKNFLNKNKKILQSKSSKLIIDDVIILGKDNNKDINSIIY